MAKPEFVLGHNIPSSSSSSLLRPQQSLHRHRRKQTHISPSSSRPSHSLLSILTAVAAASPPVIGSPLPTPPAFLCPCIDEKVHYAPRQLVTPTPSPTATLDSRAEIADRFVQGTDRLWRKTNAWTLYGSTYLSTSSATSSATSTATSSADPQVAAASAPVSSAPASSTSASVSTDFDTAVLPAGWSDDSSTTSSTKIAIIVSLSVVLAIAIVIFMVSCILWRRRSKLLRRPSQIELRAKMKRQADEASDDDIAEGVAHGRRKLWVKATARWKAGVRTSVRRRRGRRSKNLQSRMAPVLAQDWEEDTSIDILSPVPVRATSDSHSFITTQNEANRSTSSVHSLISPRDNVDAPPSSRSASAAPSTTLVMPHGPPGYDPRDNEEGPVRNDFASNPRAATSLESILIQKPSTPLSIHSHPSDHEPMDNVSLSDIPYIMSPLTAHVATDDKAHLARLVDMASAPTSDPSISSPSQIPVSAPVWEDDAMDTSSPESLPPSTEYTVPLYPPPSKEKLAAEYDDYPYSFEEDIINIEPVAEPSAPPFESMPNSSPLPDSSSLPSAPLLDDDSPEQWSAPEDMSRVFTDGEVDASTDRDDSAASIPSGSSRSPPITQPMSSTDSPFLPVQGPVASDGTLPSYHP